MKEQIQVKVKVALTKPIAVIVRKIVRDDDGNLSIYGLSQDGEWLAKPEGLAYPDECILPTSVYEPLEKAEINLILHKVETQMV